VITTSPPDDGALGAVMRREAFRNGDELCYVQARSPEGAEQEDALKDVGKHRMTETVNLQEDRSVQTSVLVAK
jgi:hypothetical protein